MRKEVKDYSNKFLDKEANIKLDFIHAQFEDKHDRHSKTLVWTLTINTGKTDEKGYVDALIIDISEAQYPSFFEKEEEDTVEFTIDQLPEGMTKKDAHDLITKYRKEIDLAIEEFENEED